MWKDLFNWKIISTWTVIWVMLFTAASYTVSPLLRFHIKMPPVVYLGQDTIPVIHTVFKWRHCPVSNVVETWTSVDTGKTYVNKHVWNQRYFPLGFSQTRLNTSVPDDLTKIGYYEVYRQIAYKGTLCRISARTNDAVIVVVSSQDKIP